MAKGRVFSVATVDRPKIRNEKQDALYDLLSSNSRGGTLHRLQIAHDLSMQSFSAVFDLQHGRSLGVKAHSLTILDSSFSWAAKDTIYAHVKPYEKQ